VTVVAASEVFYVGFAKLWDLAGRRALADGSRALTRLDAHETDGGHWADWAKPLVVQSSWERQGDPFMGRDDRAGTRPRDAGDVPFGVRLTGTRPGALCHSDLSVRADGLTRLGN
jgi:hypothetical protein